MNTNFEENRPFYMVVGLMIVATIVIAMTLFAAEADGTIVIAVGVIMGIAYRNFFPYWEKLRSGTITSYNWGYVATMTVSFLMALFTVPEILEQFTLNIDPLWSTMMTLFNAMIFAALYNHTANYLFMDKH